LEICNLDTNILKSGNEERSSTVNFSKPPTVILCLLLTLAVLTVYSQISMHDFIAYDDDQYVYENPMVKAGITPAGIHWAFFSFYYANWHPLTWLSHMLDCQMFGLKPGGHHLMNLAIHMASTLLLFIVLLKMTHRPWRSAIVAAIFGLHPIHVESVAWISERKDVLSALFGMATLLLYVRYTKKTTKVCCCRGITAPGLWHCGP
jgi:protein O-mannosyl-transferase